MFSTNLRAIADNQRRRDNLYAQSAGSNECHPDQAKLFEEEKPE